MEEINARWRRLGQSDGLKGGMMGAPSHLSGGMKQNLRSCGPKGGLTLIPLSTHSRGQRSNLGIPSSGGWRGWREVAGQGDRRLRRAGAASVAVVVVAAAPRRVAAAGSARVTCTFEDMQSPELSSSKSRRWFWMGHSANQATNALDIRTS